MSKLNKGHRISVTMDVSLPETATHAQIQEWLDHVANGGSISVDNPLVHHELEAENAGFNSKGTYQTFQVTNVALDPETGGIRYKMSRRSHPDTRSPAEAEKWQSAREVSDAAVAAKRAEKGTS